MNDYYTSPAEPAGSGFFNLLRNSGWFRAEPSVFGGVCSGIAYKLGWDRTIVRILFVILTLFFGIGVGLYGLAWLLLPHGRDGSIVLEQAVKGNLTGGLFLSALFIFIGSSYISASLVNVPLITALAVPVAVIAAIAALIYFIAGEYKAKPGVQPGYSGQPQTQAQPQAGPQAMPFAGPQAGPQAMPFAGPQAGAQTGPAAGTTSPAEAANSMGTQSAFNAGTPNHQPFAASQPQPQQPYAAPKPVAPKRPLPSRRFSLITLALMLLAIPASYLVTRHQSPDRIIFFTLCAITLVLAAAILLHSIMGRRSGWMAGVGAIMAIVLGLSVPVAAAHIYYRFPRWDRPALSWEMGERVHHLFGDYEAGSELNYSHDGGDVELIAPENIPTTIRVTVGVGDIKLDLPTSYRFVESSTGIGDIKTHKISGTDITAIITNTEDYENAKIQATLDLGFGSVRVSPSDEDSLDDFDDEYEDTDDQPTKRPRPQRNQSRTQGSQTLEATPSSPEFSSN
ncbi:PspC domain-containing protein [Boudabousia marimammalium]|uniref:Phage shock protein PspC N-terminal domain-containing protein n=1 Tax=Boudabousia marimammalium TaxID=156892 RepID=A0A1Q5PRZ9_9ACTO|nr:PspC domain-containing protein [Boudabousia marimammalium]OKL50357.1 hypothetical protein BM477_02970 [Boudabousia marimammalium]